MSTPPQQGDRDRHLMSEVAPRGSVSHPARGCRAAPGYEEARFRTLPPETVAGAAGCGDPVGRCRLQEGDVVLDLGSGTGIDLVLAARTVGPSGRVIGIDASAEMVAVAGAALGACGIRNTDVRLARIEAIPMPAASVDWVISNCSINLSNDKPRVFSEIARVLKPGAGVQIADVFTHGLPVGLSARRTLAGSCIAGATRETEYIVGLTRAGAVDVVVAGRYVYDRSELTAMILDVPADPAVRNNATQLAAALVGGVWRAYVSARKPAGTPGPPIRPMEANTTRRMAGERKGAKTHERFSWIR